MSKIRSCDTKVEKIVFRELSKRGVYFQKYYKKAIGNPGIALPSKKRAIFIDGDFWHGYQFPKLKKRLPKRYWLGKIEKNVKMDRVNRTKLEKYGWKVLRIWENEVMENIERVIRKIVKQLTR